MSAIALALLAGCASAPDTPSKGAYTTGKSGIQQADSLRQQALDLDSVERDLLLLKAAALYWAEGSVSKATATLDAIEVGNLPATHLPQWLLLNGEIALDTQSAERAARFLRNSQNVQGIAAQPADFRLRWHRTRGELLAKVGQPGGAIVELTQLSTLLNEPADVQRINDDIWTLLEALPEAEVGRGLTQSADRLVGGWYQLAAALQRAKGDVRQQIENIHDWQRQYADHPAAVATPERIRQYAALKVFEPSRIAVLLPREGDFKLAGDAIANGIVAAFYAKLNGGGKVPEVTFYDSRTESATALYQRAVDDGAQLVIGPLQREKVAELMAQPALPVPVLALNAVEEQQSANNRLYQFALAIRDEAIQVSEGAWAAGHRSALVIAPANRMGEQAASAFAADWRQQGGQIAASINYAGNQRDYSQALESALLVQQSKQRALRLQQALGKNLAFTPRRRGDLDMIFLVSYPEQGRQIKPALDYMYAADLPVFATSQIYGGSPNPDFDQDLENILFTAAPWSVKALGSERIPAPNHLPPAYRGLFAMGVDAYHLQQWLDILHTLPGSDFKGQTGSLTVDKGNRIQRRQPWARFQNGTPVVVPALITH